MDRDSLFIHKKNFLSKLILDGFVSALYCHETLFKNEEQGLNVALAYLTEAHNYYLNAETFMVDNVELFDSRHEFEDLFHRFSVFNNEVLTNIRTNHSHQWSDIEYRAFVKSFKPVADLLNIDLDRYWVNQALSDV